MNEERLGRKWASPSPPFTGLGDGDPPLWPCRSFSLHLGGSFCTSFEGTLGWKIEHWGSKNPSSAAGSGGTSIHLFIKWGRLSRHALTLLLASLWFCIAAFLFLDTCFRSCKFLLVVSLFHFTAFHWAPNYLSGATPTAGAHRAAGGQTWGCHRAWGRRLCGEC